MPLAMKINLQEMTKHCAIDFIISGLGYTYVNEWDDIYENIVLQIWEIYEKRAFEIDKVSR